MTVAGGRAPAHPRATINTVPPRAVGRSSVEIVADLSKFGRDLERDLNRELRGVDVDASPVTEQMTEQVDDAVDALLKTFMKLPAGAHPAFQTVAESAEDMAGEIERELDQVDRKIGEVERTIRDLAREFARTGEQDLFVKIRGEKTALANLRAVRAIIDEVGDEARETARELDEMGDQAEQVAAPAARSFGALAGVLNSVVSGVGSFGAALPRPGLILVITAALGALGAAVPVVLALGAALADLIGLLPALPAAAGVAAAVMGTLQLALIGVSDAVEAVLEGDPEKIAEALKTLAPAAASVVLEFKRLLPMLRGTQQLIQQDFFAPLEGALTRLVNRALPTVRDGMSGIATDLGEMGRELLRLLGTKQALDFFREVFGSARNIINRVTNSLDSVLNTLFRLGSDGTPLIEKFVDFLADGIDSFSAFLSSPEGQTAVQDFLTDALATLRELWELTKAAGNLLGAMFGGADDEGRSFLAVLTDVLNKMAEFFRSDQGQEFLQNLLDLLPLLGYSLGFLVTSLMAVAAVVESNVAIFNLYVSSVQLLIDAVIAAAGAVGGWFVGAWNTASAAVASFFSALGTFFTNLPGMLMGWLAAAGNALLAGLRFGFQAALAYVGVVIGLILFNVTQLPGLIWNALLRLPGLLSSLFSSAWNAARSITLSAATWIIAQGIALAARLIGALLSLPGRLRSIFTSALAAARAAVVSGFNSIVAFAGSVPGRLSSLAGRFLAAGRGIISGFFRGLSSGGGMAGNVGSAIVSSVRGGLNRVIGSINAGIGAIDARLPGSLPRIPSLHTGGLTTADGLAQLHRREFVLPLEDRRATDLLARALAVAAEQGQARGGDGAALQGGDINIRVYLGTREITDVVNVVVDERDRGLRRRVTAGPGQR